MAASIVDASLMGITPKYPRFSRQNHQEGRVVCKVTISPDGTIAKTDIIHSSGFDLLDAAAIKALQQAQFQAAISNGQAIASTKLIAFRFKLSN